MVALMKENVRPTTGSAAATASSVKVEDGTAAGKLSIGADRAYNPLAGDNPALVRAIIGDEVAIADLLAVGAAAWVPDDVTPNARNLLLVGSVLYGPRSGLNTALRAATVLDGEAAEVAADDNPLYVSLGQSVSAAVQGGAPVTIQASQAPAEAVAAANTDRRYLEIYNPHATSPIYIGFANTVDNTYFEVAAGASWSMGSGDAIYTGIVYCFQESGGDILVPVIEY